MAAVSEYYEEAAFTYEEPQEMHVRFGSDRSPWHRLPIGESRRIVLSMNPSALLRTACGTIIGSGYYATREESYDGDLCQSGCFTPFELELAAQLERERILREQAESEQMEIEREQSARELTEMLRQSRESIRTGKQKMLELERTRKEEEEEDK